jgi:hypothetical protein
LHFINFFTVDTDLATTIKCHSNAINSVISDFCYELYLIIN